MNELDPTRTATSHPPISSSAGNPLQESLLQRGAFEPPATPGTLGRLDRFEILRLLGEGGMGQVYLAREPRTDTQVAIKIMKPQFADSPQEVHRFLTEARHMYRLSHPHILHVLEVSDRSEDPYYVMPYIAGGSLHTQCRSDQALADKRILSIASQVAEALAHAHSHGLIHRDLKPANVLLDKEGNAFLTDFGLVRTFFNDSMVDTSASHLEGTVCYMSPAVARGEAEDTRCDIYAFGAVLYQMLAGQPPYSGCRTPQIVLDQVLKGPPRPIREVNPKANPALVRIAENCMARELRDRYASMSDVVADLDRVAKGKVAVGSRGRLGLGIRINLRRFAATIAVALAGGLLAIGLWQGTARWSRPERSVSGWQATLEKAANAYDENRFEEAIGLYDAALAAMNADQRADPSVLKIARDKASKDRELTGFILDRSKLPLPQQIELTQQKLAEFNTNYTGKGTFTATKEGQIMANLHAMGITDIVPLKGLPLTELNLWDNPVADLSPLRGMKLESLELRNTSVADLAPLKGMPLKELYFFRTLVADLTPLKGMTYLTKLDCSYSSIRDLGPLKGLPLESLNLYHTSVSDLRPLKGMPLKHLVIEICHNVTDISPLNGMPLVELFAWDTPLADLSPLRTLKALTKVNYPDLKPLLNDLYTALRTNALAQAKQEAASLIADCQSAPALSNVVAEAREIQTALDRLAQGDTGPYTGYWWKRLNERGIDMNYGYQCDTNGLVTIRVGGVLFKNKVKLDALLYVPLRDVDLGGNNLTNLEALAGLPLTDLMLDGNPVADLSPLRGMKLEVLNVANTSVADLAPLEGMPLKSLNLSESKVVDLSPLKSMTSLTNLDCSYTHIRDVGPLQGMPLKSLNIGSSPNVVDLSPLKGMTSLTEFNCAGTGIRDVGPLRGMPLKSLNLQQTPVSDLRPLTGMPLKWLNIQECPNVTNISAIQGMPLVELHLHRTPVTDLSPLQGMPLVGLFSFGVPVTDLSPFRKLKALAVVEGIDPNPLLNDLYTALRTNGLAQAKQEADALIADCQSAPAFSNVVAEAREIQTALAQLAQGDTGPYRQYWEKYLKQRGIDKKNYYACDTNGLISLDLNNGLLGSSNVTLDVLHYVPLGAVALRNNNLTNLHALAGLPLTDLDLNYNPLADLSPLQGMRLDRLYLSGTPVTDLAPLKCMPLKSLFLGDSKVVDLSPLRGLPLDRLDLKGTLVSDLRPLKGMPLKWLSVGGCPVTDISPLQGMPLTTLHAHDTGIADLTPLAGMPLEALGLDRATNVTSIAALRGMKLTFLHLEEIKIADVAVLQGMPLKEFLLSGSRVADLRPLDGMPLTYLIIIHSDINNAA